MPGDRGSISVVIAIDHLRKKGTMMQKAIVSHGKTKMDKPVRRRELPRVRRSRPLYRWRVVRGVVPMSVERKKVMKKGKRSEEMV
jgi:hypothetical protein